MSQMITASAFSCNADRGVGGFHERGTPVPSRVREFRCGVRNEHNLYDFQDFCTENGSSHGHNLALIVLCVVKRREVGDVVHLIVIVLLGHHRFQPNLRVLG